ncbi:MAG: dihydrofolate reductase family protein [archaeon]|nr:dihydrofolate reductase family protein [archaeon]
MRPFIHVNCAMSADGKIAGSDRTQVRISSQEDIQRVRILRKEFDSVLVGVGTIIADNPHLSVKGVTYNESSTRVVIDPHGRTPDSALVLNGLAPTIIITDHSCERTWRNARVIRCDNEFNVVEAVEKLFDLGIKSILVEGGGETISSFFRAGIVDIYTVFIGNIIIGGKNSPTPVDGLGWVKKGGLYLQFEGSNILGDGVLLVYKPVY